MKILVPCMLENVNMNEKEKIGCKEILNNLGIDELLSLTDTVTKKHVKVSSKSDAMKAILTYSETACQLLTRKKLKRDILFKYLVDKGVVISVNSDKKTIIRKLLETWGTVNIAEVMKQYEVDMPSNSSSAEFTNSNQQSVIPESANSTLVIPAGTSTSLTIPADTSTSCNSKQTPTDLQLLGETFATWFYKVLNSHNPHKGVNPEEFGPCHFWDEAKLLLMTISDGQTSNEEFSGSQLVSERLLTFAKDECLLFNPNISRDGVFVKTERHGLVVVLVCGTIHRQNQLLGVFDQMFGLVTDPRFNDNWKIKLTKLKLNNIQVDHVPSIQEKPESEIKDLVAV